MPLCLNNSVSKESIEDNKYLHSVSEDDALLYSLDELDEVQIAPPYGLDHSSRNADNIHKITELKDGVERLEQQYFKCVKFVDKTMKRV